MVQLKGIMVSFITISNQLAIYNKFLKNINLKSNITVQLTRLKSLKSNAKKRAAVFPEHVDI